MCGIAGRAGACDAAPLWRLCAIVSTTARPAQAGAQDMIDAAPHVYSVLDRVA